MEELPDALKSKIRVMGADMAEQSQVSAVEKFAELWQMPSPSEKKLAAALKLHLEQGGQQRWNVVVGSSFGAEVSHASGGYLFFYYEEMAVMLWRQ